MKLANANILYGRNNYLYFFSRLKMRNRLDNRIDKTFDFID